jgi:DNA-binding NarL/FixJ family response regulator
MADTATLKGLVCAGDAMVRQTVAAAITLGGYELVGETQNGPDTLGLAGFVAPDVIVIDNDLPGRFGVEWIPDLLSAHPTTAILLLANDDQIRDRAMAAGAFGVVYRSQLSELEGALRRAREWLSDPDLRSPGERRTGKDRRHHQDWAKVTAERRSGAERRLSDGDPGPTTPDR